MYIGGTQTNSRGRSMSKALGASTALGETTALSPDALKRAVTLNRVYARTIG
jgi:hypothetical protein